MLKLASSHPQLRSTINHFPSVPRRSFAANMAVATDAPPTVTSTPLFITSYVCPYVQRTWIALEEKKVPYERLEVDLGNRPAWFKQVSPANKVPVITWKEEDTTHVLHESLVLDEFVEDAFPGPHLLPERAVDKAKARLIINRFDQQVTSSFYKLLRSDNATAAHEAAASLDAEFEHLDKVIDKTGPFFLGSKLSLVDAAILPWLLRLPALEHYRGYKAKLSPRLQAYIKHTASHPSVAATFDPPTGEKHVYDSWIKSIVDGVKHYGASPVDYFKDTAKANAAA